jgi:hypothetical protein
MFIIVTIETKNIVPKAQKTACLASGTIQAAWCLPGLRHSNTDLN